MIHLDSDVLKDFIAKSNQRMAGIYTISEPHIHRAQFLAFWGRRSASAFPHPLRKFLSLFPDIYETGPALQHFERVPDVVLIRLSVAIHEAFLPFPLNLACPDAPLYGA